MMDVTLQVPLGEQMHLKEMFSVLEENHMEIESQNLENFLQYFDKMERYFGDMQEELIYLRDQLDRLNEKTLKAKMEHFIQNAGDRVGAAKMWLAALKNDLSAGVRKAVDSVKYHGGQALYAAIDKTKAARALSVIHEHLESAAASLEHSAETMGDIGVELNAAKGHKKNVRKLLKGKETSDTFEYDYDKGIIAKIRKAIEFCGKIVKNMAGHTENMLKSLDGLSQKALDNRAIRKKHVFEHEGGKDVSRCRKRI